MRLRELNCNKLMLVLLTMIMCLSISPQVMAAESGTNPILTNSLDEYAKLISSKWQHNLALKSDGTVAAWGDNASGQTNVPTGLNGVIAVAAGENYSLALKSDGTVVAWGSNYYGESSVPSGLNGVVAISAATSYYNLALKYDGTVVAWGLDGGVGRTNVPSGLNGVIAVAAGCYQGLALKSDGTVVVWGSNGSGALNIPVGLNGIVAIAAGESHSLAIKSDGTVVAWGYNADGQTNVSAGLSGVLAVSAGKSHCIVLKADGTVMAWGNNYYGQTNVPSGLNLFSPLTIDITVLNTAITDATNLLTSKSIGTEVGNVPQVAYDAFNVAIITATGVKNNTSSTQIEINTAVLDLAAATVVFNSAVIKPIVDKSLLNTAITNATNVLTSKFIGTAAGNVPQAAYDAFNAAIITATGVKNNTSSTQIEINTAVSDLATATIVFNSAVITLEVNLDTSSKLTAGNSHSLVIKEDKTLWAWGYNKYGQLGDGTTTNRTTPKQVMNGVNSVSAGYVHTLAIKENGTLWAWGINNYGQLGDGTTTLKTTPVQVMSGVKSVEAGYGHTLALKEDKTLWAWGLNTRGQLGNGNTTDRVTPVQIISGVKWVAAGYFHSLAIKEDGTLWAWGLNNCGQIGDGTLTDRTTPVQVMSNVKSVVANAFYTLAIKEDGTLWAWGSNEYGQLGNGGTTNRAAPVQVMNGVKSVTAGIGHTVVIKEDGTLWAWGANDVWQLGNGTTINRITPVQIMSGVKSVAAGDAHTLVIKEDNTLWAWGDNSVGQLGDGSTADRTTPVQVRTGNTISGTISLPVGVVAPAGGMVGYVSVEPQNGSNNFTGYFYIPGGGSTTTYTATVPVDALNTGYRVGYKFYSDLNYSGFVGKGYYSPEGTTNYSSATLINVETGNVTGIDLMILTGNTISGNIYLPAGVTAPTEGIIGYVTIEPQNGDVNYITTFYIPEGRSYVSYSLTVPVDVSQTGYRVGYNFYSDLNYSGYIAQGYYSQGGTTAYDSSALIDVSSGNAIGVNLTILVGNTISGTISLPVGSTAPEGGIRGYVSINEHNGNNSYTVDFNIPAGSSSTIYSIVVPVEISVPGYFVRYQIYRDYNYGVYVGQGFYSTGDTANHNSATPINVNAGNVDGVNLTLLTGKTISGTISLPGVQTAPVGGINGTAFVEDQNGSNSYASAFNIPSGSNSTNYSVVVPIDTSSQGYRVRYFFDRSSNFSEYVGQGYFASSGTTGYNSATFVNVDAGNVEGINLTILTGNTISGTISLPAGVKAPFGGITGNVTFEPQNGGNNYTAYFNIPTGDNLASYTAVVPLDASITGYRVGYTFYYHYHINNSGYLGNGYYSPGGTTKHNSAAFVNVSGGNINGINLTLLTTTGIQDDYNNTIGSANEISVGANISGQIDYNGDLDLFKFTCPLTGTYIIETQSNIDLFGYLYNSSGIEIAKNDDDGTDGNFIIRCDLQAGQAYYVKVIHFSDGTGSYNLLVHNEAILGYIATPLVQIGINPNHGENTGIFVGFEDVIDAEGNDASAVKLANYHIEIVYYHDRTKVLTIVDEAHLGNFTYNISADLTMVSAADIVNPESSSYEKLFFVPIALTGTSKNTTDVTIKFTNLNDSNQNQIKIPDITLTFQRGKILNQAANETLGIADAVAGLQYLAKIVEPGIATDSVNVINMASIIPPNADAVGIKPSVKDVISLMQKLVELRDDSFQLIPD